MIKRSDAEIDGRGAEWLMRAVSAGFFATVLVTLVLIAGYGLALLIGSPAGTSFGRWMWALAHNVVTEGVQTALPLALLAHFLAGIGWAVIYAWLVEPRLRGHGWERGVVFSIAPWILSLVVLLPLVGGGLFGFALGAGPLPIIGNLVAHLVYGAILGEFYVTASDRSLEERGEVSNALEALAMSHANRAMALGIIAGLVIGGLAGFVLNALFAPGIGALSAVAYGALVGSALGAVAASVASLSTQE